MTKSEKKFGTDTVMNKKERERKKLNSKNFIHNGKVYLVYCPKCGLENYAPSVARGICNWCGYDGNLNKDNQL